MKKIYILIICFALIGCGTKKDTATEKQAEPAVKTETPEVVEEKKEEPKEYIVEMGGEMEFVGEGEDSKFSFTAAERKSGKGNSYIKKMNKDKLDEGEKYYHLVFKIKNLGKETLELTPEMFQVETEDGTLYKNITDYLDTNVDSMKEAYSFEPILAGTSKEIKLNYKITGEVKSVNFVHGNKILGRLMLK